MKMTLWRKRRGPLTTAASNQLRETPGLQTGPENDFFVPFLKGRIMGQECYFQAQCVACTKIGSLLLCYWAFLHSLHLGCCMGWCIFALVLVVIFFTTCVKKKLCDGGYHLFLIVFSYCTWCKNLPNYILQLKP